jgi:WD40-like Beta Propeller Repeat
MRRTHRLSAKSIRWKSLCLCFALITSSLIWTSPTHGSRRTQSNNQSSNGKARRGPAKPPQPGAPSANLPNLDQDRHRPRVETRAAPPIESTIRSRRKPVESRSGKKVGDPIPRATPSPSATGTPRQTPSPVAGLRNSSSPSPTPSPSPAPSDSPEFTASSSSSNNAYRSIDLLSKARIRLLDHPALRFLSTHFAQTDPLDLFLTSPTLNRTQESFDLLVSLVPQSGASKIVFASNREGLMQIYVMTADGSNVVRLTNSGGNDDFPRWSPNGARILFQSDRDHLDTGYMDIYVMNADGTGVTRLTTDASDDSFASWSPDGSKIIFQNIGNGVDY